MSAQTTNQNERMMAAVAHGSILVGLFTGGIGGIGAALLIWLTQKEKSAYVAGHALQALVYQVLTLVLTLILWCLWGLIWMAMWLPPIISNPEAYETRPPDGMWIGLALIIIPLGLWGLTILYGLYGAVRCLGGHDFKYVVVGHWLQDTAPQD